MIKLKSKNYHVYLKLSIDVEKLRNFLNILNFNGLIKNYIIKLIDLFDGKLVSLWTRKKKIIRNDDIHYKRLKNGIRRDDIKWK